MRLRDMQRALRDAIREPNAALPARDASPASADAELAAYMATVVDSPRLAILNHVIRSWREFDLARACPLTTAALRARGLWQEALDSPVIRSADSAFIERLADRFLDANAAHADALVASVARFEAAYLAVRRGSDERFTVKWDREPMTALTQLMAGEPVDDPAQREEYLTIVARDLPGQLQVIRHTPVG